MPKIDRNTAPRVERRAYPGRLHPRTFGCWKTKLSDAGGLTQFGFGEVELAPGSATGLYHWHEADDELVYVLEGEVVMVEGGEETLMRAGDCATFKAGVNVGHTFENRSGAPARLLEVGPRGNDETAHYPGLDMIYRRAPDNEQWFQTKDGRRLAREDEVARVDDDPEDLKPKSPLDIA